MNTYVILLENRDKPLTIEVIKRHVAHLSELDKSGVLKLCGPFEDYPGGIVIVNVESFIEADMIARRDPFVDEGYRDYSIRTLEVANKENNYLL